MNETFGNLTMVNEREKWIDVSKGIGIFLVVLGHVISNGVSSKLILPDNQIVNINKVIYIFHMPLFFFISGYLFKIKENHYLLECLKSWIKKFIQLLIPYAFFSLVYFAFKYFFSQTSAVNNPVELNVLTNIWKDPIGEYWFLYSLMLFVSLGFLFSYIFSYIKNEKTKTIILSILTIAFSFMYISINDIASYLSIGIKRSIPFFSFFFLGLTACYSIKKEKLLNKKILFITVPLIGLLSVYSNILLVKLFLAISVVWSVLIFSSFIKSKFLEYIGKMSFPVYVLHVYFVVLFKVLIKKANLEYSLLFVFLSTILSIIFSLLVYTLTTKVKYANFVFNPKQYIWKAIDKK